MRVTELREILNNTEFADDAEVVIETSGGFIAQVSGVWTQDELIIKTTQIP